MSNEVIVVDPLERIDLLKSLASEVRVRILELLNRKGPRNVNQVAEELEPSAVDHLSKHPGAGRCRPDPNKIAEGPQGQPEGLLLDLLRACHRLQGSRTGSPISASSKWQCRSGLYTRCEVSAPCGLCSKDGVIGLLDVPDTFLDPDRMRAGIALVHTRLRRVSVPQ